MKPRLHIPGRPDIEPEAQGRQSYVTAKHHNDAMSEIDRCLRSADAVLAAHQGQIQEMQQRVAIMVARFEGLARLCVKDGIVTEQAIEDEARAVFEVWRQASEESQRVAVAEAEAPTQGDVHGDVVPESPAPDEEVAR